MRFVTVALIVLLAGCASSPPTRFYTLDPTVPAQTVRPNATLTLQVSAVHIPAVLDRQEMVRESAPERLQVSNRSRWGAPLGEMIRRVLSQDLLARLPGSTLLAPQELPPAGTRVVVLDVLHFSAGPSGRVRLQGTWSVFSGTAAHAFLSAPVQLVSAQPVHGFRAQAAAMSRLLGRLADRIAGVLAHEPATRTRPGRETQNQP